jgi:predicted esterase
MFETAISPLDAEKFSLAKYRIYIPDGIAVLRGVIIRQHGCGRNGIDMANDLQWQVLANKWAFALLGTHYEDGGNCGNWARLDSGSVQAMERAFAEFALAAQRPELTIVPWAIWGHSGGGNWAYAVGNDYPERVIAVIPRSGSNGALSDAARSVPQLLSAGLREENHDQFGRAYSSTVEAFERERPLGALVGLSLDPEATHDIREGRMLAIPYLDACIELRLPSVLGEPLRTIEPEAGWLGNIETFAVSAFTEYAGDPGSAAWLPSEEVAKRWAEFEATGQVVDTTPPPAPFTLTATREGADVRLSWTADADLESGIQRFVVYRDGVEVGSVGAPFQRGNFGDEPEPVAPEMAFVDAAASGNPTYEVTTVNFFDLESSRSPAARPE